MYYKHMGHEQCWTWYKMHSKCWRIVNQTFSMWFNSLWFFIQRRLTNIHKFLLQLGGGIHFFWSNFFRVHFVFIRKSECIRDFMLCLLLAVVEWTTCHEQRPLIHISRVHIIFKCKTIFSTEPKMMRNSNAWYKYLHTVHFTIYICICTMHVHLVHTY